MSDQSKVTVYVTRRFQIGAENVFDAFLQPEKAGRFLFATPTGKMVVADIDARVGGKFNLTDRRNGEDVAHVGEYLEIDRPRRLVFTFGVPKYSSDMTRVSIDIAALAGGGCDLTLTHEGVYADYEGRTKEGWTGILNGLAAVVGEQ